TIAGGVWGLLLAIWIGEFTQLGAQAAVILLLLAAAVTVCGRAARSIGVADPSSVVLDEIAALPLVFLGMKRLDFATLLVGFLLFRLFDIAKPRIVAWAERLPGGWGVVADDVVAAVLAAIVLHVCVWMDRAAGLEIFAASF
ncbi:MAG: phosphatidylglycerophosphatase A, partial [Planctomycetota bacterium]